MYNGRFMPIDKVVELKNKEKGIETKVIETKKVEPEVVTTPVVEETEEVKVEETAETPVLTVEEMKAKLDEAGVSYHHASGQPKLTELMKESGLL